MLYDVKYLNNTINLVILHPRFTLIQNDRMLLIP